MSFRSRYREKPVEAPNNIKLDGAEPEAVTGISVEAPPEAEQTVVEPPQPADEATQALMRQLESLRQSEELQRRHAQQMAQRQQPMTRVEFLRSQGLTEAEARFFDANESMMQNQQQASEAAADALAAGIERDSDQFFEFVEQGFAKRLDALSQRAAEQLAPAFFAPRPAPSPAAPDRSAMYSAPVSRGTPSGGTGQRPPRQIRLTAEEQEHARIAGVSDVEFAKQKQRLTREKAAGERQQ